MAWGRQFDGGYAEYTCVPASNVIAFNSPLEWSLLGAIPEMLQTAYGSMTVGLNVQGGESLLIRGGTSSVGMTAAVLGKRMGLQVFSTTRNPDKAQTLIDLGVDHVLIDHNDIADQARKIVPDGVNKALELVGTPSLPDTLRAVAVHGAVCFTGMLSNEWIVKDFYPIEYIPQGVYLTAYSGEANNLPPELVQDFLDDVAAGTAKVPVDSVFSIDQIQQAHTRMEENQASGKIIVTTD